MHAIVIGGGYMSLPPLFGQISVEQNWAMGDLQRAWSYVPLGSALVAVLTGVWLRKNGDRYLLLVAGTVSVVGLFLRATSPSLLQFSFALLLFGIGTGSMLVILTNRVSRNFEDRHAGLAQALFFGSYTTGAAVGLVSAEFLSHLLSGWRDVFLFWSALSVLALLPALLTSCEPTISDEAETSARSFSDWLRQVFPYAIVYGCYVGGYLGVVGLLPHQLRQWGWTAIAADGALAGSTFAFVAGAAFWATLTDKIGYRRIAFAAGMAGCTILVMITLSSAPSGLGFVASSSIIMIGFFGGVMALFFPILLDGIETGGVNASKSIGTTTAASYLGGFLLPFFAAPYSETNPKTSMAIFGLSFGAAGLIMVASGIRSRRASTII